MLLDMRRYLVDKQCLFENYGRRKLETKSISVSSSEQESGRRLRGVALISVITALMLTLLLEALDQTVVGTALPKIIGTLQGFDRYAWAVTAYILASTTMIPVVGKLSDQFGRKWFLLVGTAIFLLGSALSGASQTMDQSLATLFSPRCCMIFGGAKKNRCLNG